jgi:hypothetical protein
VFFKGVHCRYRPADHKAALAGLKEEEEPCSDPEDLLEDEPDDEEDFEHEIEEIPIQNDGNR